MYPIPTTQDMPTVTHHDTQDIPPRNKQLTILQKLKMSTECKGNIIILKYPIIPVPQHTVPLYPACQINFSSLKLSRLLWIR